MAKSFKQVAAAKEEQSKRTSEKDIFDFLEEDRKPGRIAKSNPEVVDNIDNTSKKDSGSNSSVTAVTSIADTSPDGGRDVRQTFIVGEEYLERLKDYVHTQRIQGRYEYTQKQALHEALDALFANATIESRPEHIRKQEEARKQKIRRGIPK